MGVFCGIDWAEGHHDAALVDDTGKQLAKCRINDDLDGYRLLLDLLAEHGDSAETPIPWPSRPAAACSSPRCDRAPARSTQTTRWQASRYRDRHGVSRKKSDPGNALVLANIIRTDAPVHRPLPADTWPRPSPSWPAHSRTRSLTPELEVRADTLLAAFVDG
ncbi:transposase [Streptomyces virginiae]|uniref:IS110 family transposase n=1 Tax=Streptomyces virginiae TaxID=1961 RepID=UPI0033B9EB15